MGSAHLVRAYGLDAEESLRRANLKFERRFRAMEDIVGGHEVFAALSLDEQEQLWGEVKRREP